MSLTNLSMRRALWIYGRVKPFEETARAFHDARIMQVISQLEFCIELVIQLPVLVSNFFGKLKAILSNLYLTCYIMKARKSDFVLIRCYYFMKLLCVALSTCMTSNVNKQRETNWLLDISLNFQCK